MIICLFSFFAMDMKVLTIVLMWLFTWHWLDWKLTPKFPQRNMTLQPHSLIIKTH